MPHKQKSIDAVASLEKKISDLESTVDEAAKSRVTAKAEAMDYYNRMIMAADQDYDDAVTTAAEQKKTLYQQILDEKASYARWEQAYAQTHI